MIDNTNASKQPSTGDFVDVQKFIGVASVNVVGINPDNAKLRSLGWAVPEGAEEPNYVTVKDNEDGTKSKSARVRFLVQIKDLQDGPVIALDFWVRPEKMISKENKYKIIDKYGQTAWGTKEECTNRQIPQYASGPATICTPYKPCHSGEEELVSFLRKYLNVTPFRMFDKTRNTWVESKTPGTLTIDNWEALCNGDVKELKEYVALRPDNCVKIILGVRTNEDNKTYQTFMNSTFIGNGAKPVNGLYASATTSIEKYNTRFPNSAQFTTFSAEPVKAWKEQATAVTDNSSKMFDDDGNFAVADNDDDLPFA